MVFGRKPKIFIASPILSFFYSPVPGSRESLSEGIINDLANYRHKRIMGLAGMFGDHLLGSKGHMTVT